MARAARRRPRAAARGARAFLRRDREPALDPRRAADPQGRGRALLHGAGARAHARGARRSRPRFHRRPAASRTGSSTRCCSPTSTSTTRRCCSCCRWWSATSPSSADPGRRGRAVGRWARDGRGRRRRAEIGAGPDGFAYDNERPRHPRQIKPFRIDRTPVTNAAFAEYLADTGAEPPMYWERDGEGGWVTTHMGRVEPIDRATARRPRLLAPGGCVRPLGRQAPPDRVRVGGGGARRRPRSRQP